MLASFSVAPVGVGESLSKYVAEIISLIDESGLDYRMGAMHTTVEGPQEEVMSLIMDCHNLMKEKAGRVLTSITIDDRKGATGRLTGKIDDVEKIIGRDISKE
ncbi:MAG: MTH1187 family thiamine-binding protein [Candidatus Krumholzibacteriota bacterium]|nr:MTH1187 family thiamine-binding protein [Candidatus Krumholzibacteriota bacterium]